MWAQKFKKLLSANDGNILVMAAIMAPIVIVGSAGVIDFVLATKAKQGLQNIADAVALAGAKEMTLANVNSATLVASTKANIDIQMASHFAGASYTPNVLVNVSSGSVLVDIELDLPNMITDMVFKEGIHLTARSEAVAKSGFKICAIALNDNNSQSLSVVDQAKLQAAGCSLYANSLQKDAIILEKNTTVAANLLCSSGGIENASRDFFGSEVTDCPPIADPLANKPAPKFSVNCDYRDMEISKKKKRQPAITLKPGVYCGGLRLDQKSKVTLEPGEYIMRDGALIVEKQAELFGDDIGFYFTGDYSGLVFERDSQIELAAPTSGSMAGILFMEDADMPLGQEYRISSEDARKLLGTIYLPKGTFVVDSQHPVGAESAYTIVVANQIKLSRRPNLYLNSDYTSTPVPVPDGIGPIGGEIYIKQ